MNQIKKLEKLRYLRKGWFCGDSGEPIADHLIISLIHGIKTYREAFLCMGKALIQPTVGGGILLEWRGKSIDTTLEITQLKAYYKEPGFSCEMDIHSITFWNVIHDRVMYNLEYEE